MENSRMIQPVANNNKDKKVRIISRLNPRRDALVEKRNGNHQRNLGLFIKSSAINDKAILIKAITLNMSITPKVSMR